MWENKSTASPQGNDSASLISQGKDCLLIKSVMKEVIGREKEQDTNLNGTSHWVWVLKENEY